MCVVCVVYKCWDVWLVVSGSRCSCMCTRVKWQNSKYSKYLCYFILPIVLCTFLWLGTHLLSCYWPSYKFTHYGMPLCIEGCCHNGILFRFFKFSHILWPVFVWFHFPASENSENVWCNVRFVVLQLSWQEKVFKWIRQKLQNLYNIMTFNHICIMCGVTCMY